MNVSGSSKALGQAGSNTKYIKIALLVTFAFLVCCSYVVFKGFQTMKWPTVKGKIIESHLIRLNKGSSAKIVYTYSVDGKDYWSNRITVESMFHYTTDAAKVLATKYENKSTVTVYYNPRNPADSVLKPGASSETYFGLVVAIISLLVEFNLLRVANRKQRQDFTLAQQEAAGSIQAQEPPPIPQEFENLEPAAGQKTQQKVLLVFILLCFVIAFGIVFMHMMSR